MGSLLDPVADKVLVLAVLIVLVGRDVFQARWSPRSSRASSWSRAFAWPPWNVRRPSARDLGKLKTWTQSVAAIVGGLAAAGAWQDDVAWWALLAAMIVTWVSGLDYARVAPGLLRSRAAA